MNEKCGFILIGKSGSGKGTQAEFITKFLNEKDPNRGIFNIQSGNEFRRFIQGDSHTKKLAKDIYDVGGLEPEFLSILMWANHLSENYNGEDHIIIDGSPRLYHEAFVMDSTFSFYGIKKVYVIYINVSDTWATSRLMERGREDDNTADIKKRLEWFATNVTKVIEYYRENKNYIFVEVNGEQNTSIVHKEFLDKAGLN